jgi:transposase InsO family protein
VKYDFIQTHRDEHSVARLCRMLSVSRSGYYAGQSRPESRWRQSDRLLLEEIRQVHQQSRECYGALKTWKTLQAEGTIGGKHRIARLRRQHGIEAKRRRRFRASVNARGGSWSAPDLVQRQFQAPGPNRIWVGDVTFIRSRGGWLFLAMLLDLYSRRIVGWSMSNRHDEALVTDALKMALTQRRPARGLIHHTDRGRLYACGQYRQVLQDHGLQPSMGRKGDCYDNAAAESFFSTLKNELIHSKWFQDRDEARAAIFDYIEVFYNRKRRHQALDYRSPDEFERINRGA